MSTTQMAKKQFPDLTQELLYEVLNYNPHTGYFTWKTKKYSKTVKRGAIAGTLDKAGYRVIALFGKRYFAHHLVWFYVHGVYPEKQIDHVNHSRDDNSLSNLREVTHEENSRNRGISVANSSGAQGVFFDRRRLKWKAEITLNRKKVYQAFFEDFDEACAARETKLIELGFHENHGK